MRNLKQRIDRLEEAMLPLPVIRELSDGTYFYHPGPALKFYMEGITHSQVPIFWSTRRPEPISEGPALH